MKNRSADSRGMTEVTSVVLVIGLILVLAVVIYVLAFANFNPAYMKKTVYVGATADSVDIPRASGLSDHFLSLMPKSGDRFYLIGQQAPDISGTKTSLRLVSPGGGSVSPRTGSLSGVLYGKQLYIYPNNSGSATMCDYDVSTAIPSSSLRPMAFGVWKIQLIDEEQHVLANSYDVAMRYGSASLPTAGGFISGLFRSDCSPYTRTVYGTLPSSINTSVGNMTVTRFNGASYLYLANDPGLSMTGDMAISLWMDPTATGDYANPANWHQLIGKGSLSGSSEDDNYQLFQMGNKLVFEWNDRVTNTHYQAITQNPVLGTNWNYVTASVSGGAIKIYTNGAEVPLVYNQGLDPRSSSLGTTPPSSGVRLKANTNPVTIGRQNGPAGAEFYYNGDIGALSLYNRALTPAEIARNYAGYRA